MININNPASGGGGSASLDASLNGLLIGTGGVFAVTETGTAGQVLQSDGDNTYTWVSLGTASHNAVTIGTDGAGLANGLSLADQEITMTTASATVIGTLSTALFATFNSKLAYITTGILGVSAPFNTDQTRYVLGGAVNISLNTATIWATTFSGTNFYGGTFSGNAVKATTVSGTTIYATTLSGVTARVNTAVVGSLDGIFFGTGGIVDSVATGGVGQFLYQSGANTYAYASTQASLPTVTTGIISGLLPITTDNTRYVLGGTLQLSLNTSTIWATTLSATNFYGGTHSGSAIQATTISGTTVYAVTLSGTTARVSTGIVGSLNGVFFSTGGVMTAIATDSVGKFLVQSGANVYSWANTAAQAGLGTDVVVPYTGGVSSLLLGAYRFSATGITCGTLQGVVISTGGSFSAVATGAVGSFFVQSGANTYSWANTSSVGGLGTDTVVPYLGAVSDLNLGAYTLSATIITGSAVRATVLSGTTVYASTCSATNVYATTFSGTTVKADTLSGTTLYATTISGTNAYITTISSTTVKADTLSSTTLYSTNVSAGTIYATTYSGTTVKADTFSGTTFYATTYSGITARVSTAIVGTLNGQVFSTGGILTTVATGAVGSFFVQSGANVYSWANTAASLPTVTTGIISGLLPIVTDNTRYVLGGTLQMSLNTNILWAITHSGTNFYGGTHSGSAVQATTLSGTTLYATTSSAVTARASTQYVFGADNPTQTAVGGIAVKSTTTSGGGFRIYTDAEYTIPVYQSKSFCITAPSGAATYMLFKAPYNLTLRNVYCFASGGTVTGALYECDGNGATAVSATAYGAITGTTTTASNIVNGTIDAGDFIDWITTSTGGTTTQFACSVFYSMDTA